MFLKDWPIPLSGTLKNITPEQAKQMFNYDMPKDATGITFQRYSDTKIVLTPYYPNRHFNKDWRNRKKIVENYQNLSKLMRIKKQLPENLQSIWRKEAIIKHSYPQNVFISSNSVAIRQKIENLILSVGKLQIPTIVEAVFINGNINLEIVNPENCEIGVIVIDRESLNLEYIAPRKYENQIEFQTTSNSPVVFIYAQKDNEYSMSVSRSFN